MPQEELGVMNLSSALGRQGHDTYLVQMEKDDLREAFGSFAPDYAAWPVLTGTHRMSLEANLQMKKEFDFISIFGGPHCTFFPENASEPGVDYQVRGPGESAMVRIVNGDAVDPYELQPYPEDPDLLPFGDRELLYRYPEFRDNPMKNIITIRGCPNKCTYCHNRYLKELYRDQIPRVLRRRSVANVIEEIESIRSRYPLEKVLFIDEHFLIYPKWVEEFCSAYRRDVALPFLVSLRVDDLREDQVKLLKDAGLVGVNCALESSNPAIRRDLLARGGFTNDQMRSAATWFKRHGIRVRIQNMIGLPTPESFEDAKRTLKFNRDLAPDESWSSLFQPFPGTALGDYCEEHGYLPAGTLKQCRIENIFHATTLKLKDGPLIDRLQKWWCFVSRYNLPDPFIHILPKIRLPQAAIDYLVEARFVHSCNDYYLLGAKAPKRPNNQIALQGAISDEKWVVMDEIISRFRLSDGFAELIRRMPDADRFVDDLSRGLLKELQ